MRALLLSVVIACGSGPAIAPAPAPPKVRVGDLGVDIANLTAQLPPYIESIGGGDPSRAFAGYVLVAQHDQVIWSGAYGMADREHQRVPTADTSFRVGSITKQFTATAILRLQQDGKLAVSDPVSKYLPEFPGPGKDVTIHQLLEHTAGIPNYTQEPAILARKNERWTTQQLLELFWERPLENTPGSEHKYSNSGYLILGAIIEKVSGQSYAAYLQHALFEPAGMHHTEVGDALNEPDRAVGYQREGKAIIKADPIDMSFPFAAGAIRSTANDLVRWHRALSKDGILDAKSRALLETTEGPSHYGYGWMHADVRGHKTMWHNGAIDGFRAMLWRVPDADLVVIAWTNVYEVNPDPIGKAAIEAALGGKLTPEAVFKPGTFDKAIADRVIGTYALAAGEKDRLLARKLPQTVVDKILTIDIGIEAGHLILHPNGQGIVALDPTDDGAFVNRDFGIHLTFTLGATGPATALALEQGGLIVRYARQ